MPLESYVPGRTWYIPAEIRAQLATPIAHGNGTAAAPAWRDPTEFNRIATDLAWRSGWLDMQWIEEGLVPFSMADVTAWLAQPEARLTRRDVQLGWNQRTALNLLLSRAPDVAMTREWLVGRCTARSRNGCLDRSPTIQPSAAKQDLVRRYLRGLLEGSAPSEPRRTRRSALQMAGRLIRLSVYRSNGRSGRLKTETRREECPRFGRTVYRATGIRSTDPLVDRASGRPVGRSLRPDGAARS